MILNDILELKLYENSKIKNSINQQNFCGHIMHKLIHTRDSEQYGVPKKNYKISPIYASNLNTKIFCKVFRPQHVNQRPNKI